MAKLQSSQFYPNPESIKDPAARHFGSRLIRLLDDVFRKIAKIPFNKSEVLTVSDSGNANTEFALTHYLGRVPAGFVVTKSDKACSVYDSGTTWTSSSVDLKCDAANTALSIMVY